MGADKVAVAQILKDHGVLVRGGPEQGSKLMDALVVGITLLVALPCVTALLAVAHMLNNLQLFPCCPHGGTYEMLYKQSLPRCTIVQDCASPRLM